MPTRMAQREPRDEKRGDRTDLLRRVALAEAEQAKGQAREAALAARLIDAESDLASLVALEAEASEQRRRAEKEGARAERAERVLRDVTSSVSWRLTRPLRAGRSVFSARDR